MRVSLLLAIWPLASALVPPTIPLRFKAQRYRAVTDETSEAPVAAVETSAVEAAPVAAVEAEVEAPTKELTVSQKFNAEENPDQPDIIRKFVKRRDDWWSEGSLWASPVSASETGPIRAIAEYPVPSYAYLLTSTVFSIAFIGSIFQLFNSNPPAPVLGVPLTTAVLVFSGPAFVFLFLVAITRGQKEADDDDDANF